MSSKIKVDTIENVAGSGNVSLGSGHNLVVPGNITGQGTAAITSNATVGGTLGVTGDLTVDTNTLFVDASENTVGIKNTAPGNYLDGELTVGDSSKDQYINVVTGSSNAAGLCFQDTTGTSIISGLRYTHLDNKLAFWANGGEKANINSSGHISAPLQPTFVAYKVGNQSVAQTVVQVTGFTTILDVGSNWDNAQNRYTVPSAGIYLAGGFWQSSGTTGLHFGILKNGAAYGNDSLLDVVDASANGYSVPFSMAANDYFTWVAYNSVTKTINANRSKIWVIKVA